MNGYDQGTTLRVHLLRKVMALGEHVLGDISVACWRIILTLMIMFLSHHCRVFLVDALNSRM
jgi:hypothetical protein